MRKNKWLKALNSQPAKLTPVEKKKLMTFDRMDNVEKRYTESTLCHKVNGIYRQGYGY
jgi:hypothetical protein